MLEVCEESGGTVNASEGRYAELVRAREGLRPVISTRDKSQRQPGWWKVEDKERITLKA